MRRETSKVAVYGRRFVALVELSGGAGGHQFGPHSYVCAYAAVGRVRHEIRGEVPLRCLAGGEMRVWDGFSGLSSLQPSTRHRKGTLQVVT